MSEVLEFRPQNSSKYSSESIRRKTVGVTIRQDLYAIAREYGINLSKLLESSLIQLIEQTYTPKRSFLDKPSFTKEGLVLRPGFEPGSVAREATILNRTILPEPAKVKMTWALKFLALPLAKLKK